MLFSQLGFSAASLHSVVSSSKDAQRFTRLKVGQVVEFKKDETGELLAIRSKINDLETIRVDRQGDTFAFTSENVEPETRTRFAKGEINSSLFLSAQQAGLSHNLTMQMANIFGYDVDFAREIRKGDSFEVLFEELHVGDKRVGTNNILAARFTNRGKVFTAVRFTDKNGNSSYYRADGTSMRKAFIRTPVELARISSRYNPNRRHPVLKTVRPHLGVGRRELAAVGERGLHGGIAVLLEQRDGIAFAGERIGARHPGDASTDDCNGLHWNGLQTSGVGVFARHVRNTPPLSGT